MDLLNSIFSTVIPFTVLLGLLVFVHELGHFLVARACGVKVEVFSIGFGKKIFTFRKGDTDYCISLIPLGGYVKMFGELSTDDKRTFTEEEKKVAFTHKTVGQRIAIVLAGPLMNFFFAIALFAGLFYFGEETRSSRIAQVSTESQAAQSGLKSNDLITAVNGVLVKTYEDFQNQLNENINKTVTLNVVRNKSETTESLELQIPVSEVKNPNIFAKKSMIGSLNGVQPLAVGSTVAVISNSIAEKAGFKIGDEIISVNNKKIISWSELENTLLSQSLNAEVIVSREKASDEQNIQKLKNIGEVSRPRENITLQLNLIEGQFKTLSEIGFESPELYLDVIVKDSPAQRAELMRYDKIIAINGESVTKWEQVLNTIRNYQGGEALELKLLREGTEVVKKLTPQMTTQMTLQGKEDKRYTIGILPIANIAQPEIITVKADHIFHALQRGVNRTWDISVMTVMSFVRLFQGEVSHKNVGGMISIGKAAKDSYAMGMQAFLSTMAIMSISLFILNLLPVPVLDGGHLVFYMIEIVKGSPLSGKKLEIAYQIGFALMMGLMVLALFNDFTKFIF